MRARLLVLDNYDSFTFNLVQLFGQFSLKIRVVRSDEWTVDDVRNHAPDYLLISPGPKNPSSAGISVEVIRQLRAELPMLGVCLGMQCMNEAFGGQTVRAPLPLHGKTSPITHSERGLFAGLQSPLTVARYHSLVVANLDPVWRATAHAPDGVVMAIEHERFPLFGVQFHPESFLTDQGLVLIENFLRLGKKKKG